MEANSLLDTKFINCVFRMWLGLVAIFFTIDSASGKDHWRGFRDTGSNIIEADLPTKWSEKEGIAWQVDIPGYGQSTPVVWNGQVYVTSSDGPFQETCQVHAYSLRDGSRLWASDVTVTTKVENYFRNSRAAPTCCVDDAGVYSFFASGDLTAMKHSGETVWTTGLFTKFGDVNNERGVASSPAQNSDLLFVLIDHDGPSYLAAVRKSDGDIAWKADRGNRTPSWSSPVVAQCGDREIVIASSADTVDAYDAETGQSLWQLDGLQGNQIPSACVVNDQVYIGSTTMFHGASDENTTAASNCCLTLTNVNGKPGFIRRWSAQRANSYYSTPLAFAGYVYYVNKIGVLFCIDQQSGQQVFAKRIENPCWASAIGVTKPNGEQLVYFVQKNGFTLVLRPGRKYDEVARNRLYDEDALLSARQAAEAQRKENAIPKELARPKDGPEKFLGDLPESQLHEMFSYGDPMVYGVAVAGDHLLIRTGQQLFCVGGP